MNAALEWIKDAGRHHFIVERLGQVTREMEQQGEAQAGAFLPVWQCLEVSGKWGTAYETLVRMLESGSFRISGQSAVALLEVGLLLQFKTEREGDEIFDFREAV